MKYIHLIRHGQSMGNLESDKTGVIHGRYTNTQLTPHGVDQVTRTAKLLKSAHLHTSCIIYSSPMLRTIESATIIKNELAIEKIVLSDSLLDIDFGTFEGRTWEQVRNEYSEWFLLRSQHKHTFEFPNGESLENVQNRVRTFVDSVIRDSAMTHHIICTHEEVIRLYLGCYHDDPIRYTSRKHFDVPNASISIVGYDRGAGIVLQVGSDTVPPLLSANNIFHINDWYKRKTATVPDSVQPRKNYSENQVYIASIGRQKETVKYIPHANKEAFYKDKSVSRYLRESLQMPTPHIISEDGFDDGILVRRTYMPGRIAEYWLSHTDSAQAVAMLMGHALRRLHDNADSAITLPGNSPEWNLFIEAWMQSDLQTLRQIDHPLCPTVSALFSQSSSRNLYYSEEKTFLHNDYSSYNLSFDKQRGRFINSGLWDFERAMCGDSMWDLAVSKKISFFKGRDQLFDDFCAGYFGGDIGDENQAKLELYLLLNITGAIRYKLQHSGDYNSEIENLEYAFERGTFEKLQ